MSVSVGFRIKTGRALAVVLHRPGNAVELMHRAELILCDPKRPETFQPYHVVMDLSWAEAEVEAKPLVETIQSIARTAVRELLEQAGTVEAAAVVGGSDNHPSKIGNPHIRAHAAEGQLFRRVVETALREQGIESAFYKDKSVVADAAKELGLTEAELRTRLTQLGRGTGSWRMDEKYAAAAGWAVGWRTIEGWRNRAQR